MMITVPRKLAPQAGEWPYKSSDAETLIRSVRALAAYKAPERIVAMETDLRGAAGKLDYPHVRRVLAGQRPAGIGHGGGDDLNGADRRLSVTGTGLARAASPPGPEPS